MISNKAMAASLPVGIASRLAAYRSEHGDTISLDQVGDIVESLLQSLRGDITGYDLKIYSEIEGLARYIRRAKEEIRAVQPGDISTKHIPLANGELDAIGAHLEEATGTILDACEGLERAAAGASPEVSAAIASSVTRIFEACSFQDLTGQRITKVIATLQTIEGRIERLLLALGHELRDALSTGSPDPGDGVAHAPPPPPNLLNGPALPGTGNSQADIDALFASL